MNKGKFRVAIVGASSLKGKELADVLNDRHFPAEEVKLLDDEESLGTLEAVGDEVSFIQTVLPEQFRNVDFAFYASDADFTQKNWSMAQRAGCAIVDLSYSLEGERGATVRAPWLERELNRSHAPELQPAPVVVAHAAAQVLAVLLLRAQKVAPIARAVATVFEPASEHGRRGMDELHEQTVSLLSFRDLPKNVFDTQVAFNMVSRYGDSSQPALETVERRIASHFRKIAGDAVPVPSLMLMQAPSFHGHVFSLYVELEKPVAAGDLSAALEGDRVEITRSADDSPSNVNAAGQDDVLVSLRNDPQNDRGFLISAAADNLRLAASTAVECAETMAAARPRGQVQ
jgi:aspartate-semialdehyde dehydrogenase